MDCEGDALLCCQVSSSGALLAFGDSGGFVHLWGGSEAWDPNLPSIPLEPPSPIPYPPRQPLSENGPFSAAYR